MPRFDGTGPVGRGRMTGWGRGNCIMPVRAFCNWTGARRAPGRRYTAADRVSTLRDEIAALRGQIGELQKRSEK